MARKHESNRHIEDLTQAEVSAVIRYLAPDLRSTNTPDYDAGVAICIVLVLVVLGCLVFHLPVPVKAHDWLRRFENEITCGPRLSSGFETGDRCAAMIFEAFVLRNFTL
jgi:hypothetical protein